MFAMYVNKQRLVLFCLKSEHVAGDKMAARSEQFHFIWCQCRLLCAVLQDWSWSGHYTLDELLGADGSDLDTCCVLLCQFTTLKCSAFPHKDERGKPPHNSVDACMLLFL